MASAMKVPTAMSTQALADEKVQTKLKELMPAQGQLWEERRGAAGPSDEAGGSGNDDDDDEPSQPTKLGWAGGAGRSSGAGAGAAGMMAAEAGATWPEGNEQGENTP